MKPTVLGCIVAVSAYAQTVDIGVFSLFKATSLIVSPANGPILAGNRTLEGRRHYTIDGAIRVAAKDGGPTDFILAVPGKIERRFYGTLDVRVRDRKLIPVVHMDLETAVASVVAAEMPKTASLEALKAQAVVARSFYAASGRRHDDYAFCDSTHCQFLRELPRDQRAAFETRSLILNYDGHPIAALYSASCGGRTLAREGSDYAYRAVDCEYCRRNLRGMVQGHQLGLCQNGAAGMAAAGAGFRAILEHYYPASTIENLNRRTFSNFLLPVSSPLSHSKD